MLKTEIEKISAMIEEFETLKRAKEKYYSHQKSHSKAHLGLSPDSTEKALWSEAQQLIDEIEVDLVELWDCIEDCTTGEDNFGGWVIPTGTFRQNISRDIKYAINSRDPNLMAPLIQQFKRIQRRLEIESQQEQQQKQTTEKSATTDQNTTTAKDLSKELEKPEVGTQAYPGPRRQVPTSDADRQRAFLGGYTVGEYKYAPDLPRGETATKQNTAPAKRCGIWTLVKRIPRWIYVLVIFLAALLTCIYLSWWLWMKFSA